METLKYYVSSGFKKIETHDTNHNHPKSGAEVFHKETISTTTLVSILRLPDPEDAGK
jgi:hypothetical protein